MAMINDEEDEDEDEAGTESAYHSVSKLQVWVSVLGCSHRH